MEFLWLPGDGEFISIDSPWMLQKSVSVATLWLASVWCDIACTCLYRSVIRLRWFSMSSASSFSFLSSTVDRMLARRWLVGNPSAFFLGVVIVFRHTGQVNLPFESGALLNV